MTQNPSAATKMVSQQIETPDGISWYTERFISRDESSDKPSAEWIVLIPSGEGDCYILGTVASLLCSNGQYQVLTFDTPGCSRTTAPPEAYAKVTAQLLARQIIGLLNELKIERASFFGCSSGGGTTLALSALYPSRVKCGVVHEVPFDRVDFLEDMQELSDEEITAVCQGMFGSSMIEQDINDGRKKWQALPPEYHARLAKNYVTWIRGYCNAIEVGGREIASIPENLQQRPIFWTVGSLNEGADGDGGVWKSNFELASNAGLTIDTKRLRSMHFPAVTIPEDVANWIAECVQKADK